MEKLASLPVYLTPIDARTDAAMETSWRQVLDGTKAQPDEIPMKGRVIPVPLAGGRAARSLSRSL